MSLRWSSDDLTPACREPHSGDDLPLFLRALIIAGAVLGFGLLMFSAGAWEGLH